MGVKRKKVPAKEVDEQEIASDHENSDQERSASEDDFFETPDEKRVRLAKEYLQKFDGKTEVQEQLDQDLDEKEGRSRFQVADFTYGEPHFHRGHKFAATCSWLTEDDRALFTGSKDCAILRWDVETGSKDVFHAGGPADGHHCWCRSSASLLGSAHVRRGLFCEAARPPGGHHICSRGLGRQTRVHHVDRQDHAAVGCGGQAADEHSARPCVWRNVS